MAPLNEKDANGFDLSIGYLNARGQTKLNKAKQLMIQNLLIQKKLDILNLQEIHLDDHSFEDCDFIRNHFQILRNNSENGYGVASLVKRCLAISEVCAYPGGRILSFKVGETRLGNVYLPSGTEARSEREEFCGKIIPEVFLGAHSGVVGGDWNAITNAIDTTCNPDQKISRNLGNLAKTFNWEDCFRLLFPKVKTFSHVYKRQGIGGLQEGASRLDRAYKWGKVKVIEANYVPVAFSDHWMHQVKVRLQENPGQQEIFFKPFFKVSPELAKEELFKSKVKEVLEIWEPAKNQMDLLEWWDLVKSDIREAAKKMSYEKKKGKKAELNYLMLLQTFLAAKVAGGDLKHFDKLKATQERIKIWFEEKSEEIFLFAGISDAAESETTRSYHYEKLTRSRHRSSIVKLKDKQGTEVDGHRDCARLLCEEVQQLFGFPVVLNEASQETMLEQVDKVFTVQDNQRLERVISDEEVRQSLGRANRLSCPGSDAICYSVYHSCWDLLGHHLSDVLREVVTRGVPSMSQRHSILVFSPKSGKEGSLRTKDLRRISLLQADMKLLSSTLADRLKKSESRTLSPMQFSAGPKRINHAISKARDAVNCAGANDKGWAIVETDFVSAFEKMSASWIWKVMKRKGCSEAFISVLRSIYEVTDSFIVPMVNNEQQPRLINKRKNIRTGDSISTCLFNYGADPLIISLNKKLRGVTYFKAPTEGPYHPLFGKPLPVTDRLKAIGFVDDCKGFLSCQEDFTTMDSTLKCFEKSTGSELHRDTETKKCSVLPLGKWKRWRQCDSPLPYMAVVTHLNFLGVKLGGSMAVTRRLNGEELVAKVQSRLNHYKVARQVPLICKPHIANCFLLSKVSYKASVVDLRKQDLQKISSATKAWVNQQLLKRPKEILLYRSKEEGGLGLVNVVARAGAKLTKTFLDQCLLGSPYFNNYLNAVFRTYVLEESDGSLVNRPPFITHELIAWIREAIEDGENISLLSTKMWQNRIRMRSVTHVRMPDSGLCELIETDQESKNPEINWEKSRSALSVPGLSPAHKGFIFMMTNDLLPNNAFLYKIKKTESPLCSFCDKVDSRLHFLACPFSGDVGEAVLNILVEATENKLNIQQLKVLELDTAHHLLLPALFILAEACLLLMEQRKQGKAAAKLSSVAEKILTKANYVKATRHHKNCFPFVQDWLERYLVRDASRQENVLLKLCDQDSPGLPPHPLSSPTSLSPLSQPSLGSDSLPHPRGSSASPATGASTP